MKSKLLVFGILGLAAAGCSGGGGSGACANVKCDPGLTCEPTTGKCVGGGPDGSGGGADLTMTGAADMTMSSSDGSSSDDGGMGSVDAVCKAAMNLTVNNGMATASGDTTNLLNNTLSPNCGGDSGADIAYVLGLNSPQLVDLTVTPDPSTPNYIPIVYIRSNCTDETGQGELSCSYGDVGVPAETSLVLKGGSYYIFVDGDQGTVGKYTLTVTLSAPPPVPKYDTSAMP
jgi:hypothetical protein